MPRPDLLRSLVRSVERPLTLICAPAGFGKSLLLQDWLAHHDDGPVVWLPLDKRDDDGARLAARLVSGLNAVDADLGTFALERVDRSGASLGEHFVAQLVDDLEMAGRAALVIDGLDTITEAGVMGDLLSLIDQAPPTLQVVVSTRFDPDHRWLRQPARELRQADLAFDRDEAGALLNHVSGRTLTGDQIEAVLRRTEGWPAGLHLFGLALRWGGEVDELVEGLSGADATIGDYLAEEVFTREHAPVQRFLLQTSVLRRLSPALCEAVTGEAQASDLLRHVERRSLFLVPADEQGDGSPWFRYQRLFGEWARRELAVAGSESEAALLSSAADWHISQGQLDDAMHYLIEARDWDRVLDLTAAASRSLFEQRQGLTATRWLQEVPEAVRRTRPALLLVEAILLTVVGATVEAEDVVDALIEAHPPSFETSTVINALRAVWVQYHSGAERATVAADAVLRSLDEAPTAEYPDPLGLTSADHLRSIALVSRGRASWYQGDDEGARRDLRQVCAGSDEYGPWRINALGSLGLVDLWSGDLREADRRSTEALMVAAQHQLPNHPSSMDALFVSASLSRERNQLGRAEMLLEQALAFAVALQRGPAVAVHAVERASLDLALMDARGGLDRFADFVATGSPDLPLNVSAALVAAEGRLRLAVGDLPAAQRLLEGFRGLPTGAVQAMRVQFSVLGRDLDGARAALRDWEVVGRRSQIDRAVWSAVVADLGGDPRLARQHMGEAVRLAEPEGYVRIFRDAGPEVLRILSEMQDRQPTAYGERVLDGTAVAASSGAVPEPNLSPREMAVLSYLPGRFSNAELAAELFISQNTVKSHLHRIYRQLNVTGRREAVIEAERRGLL